MGGGRRPPFWERVAHIAGDRTDRGAFVTALRGKRFDVVVDNIAFVRADVEAADLTLRGDLAYAEGKRECEQAASTRPSMHISPS